MNIIKLKDKLMSPDIPWAPYFNKHLKGKYAYWVQMRYIVSFDHMGHEGYIACENNINELLPCDGVYPKPFGAPCIDVYDETILPYIDNIETDRINSTIDFRIKNKYVTDDDITIDEVKLFRTWLATELLKMDQTESGKQKTMALSSTEEHILKYYANNAYDDTIKILSEFGGKVSKLTGTQTKCGCGEGSDIHSLYDVSICDPISIYRENIHYKMVSMFSNVDFWLKWSPEFLGNFKKYIDNIIKLNLPLADNTENRFSDCTCKNSVSNDAKILERLSESISYMITGNVNGHKNYIYDALYEWSSKLYENMIW